jgi:ribonuclease R
MAEKKSQERLKKKLLGSIRAIFQNNVHQKLNYKQISAKLFLKKPHERMLVSAILLELKEQGLIEEPEKGKFRKIAKKNIQVKGKIEITRRGAGYMESDLFEEDIFISSKETGKALNGDEVLVEVDPNEKKPQGKVIDVISRARDTFVGLIEVGKNQAFVITDDFKIHVDFYVPLEQLQGAKDGDKVIIRLVDWPERAKSPFAKILNVLGPAGDHNVEMHAILFEYGLPYEFPNEVKKAASAISEGISEKEIAKRNDFREITTFTIDPEDAKDFDDALSIEYLDGNNIRIGVHIADVSHYVTQGSIIDIEAYERSTSVYLVDRVVPMLPEILSNVICSLRPNEDKLTYSVVFEINERAEIKNVWIGKSIIHSNKRFTYEEAQEIIEGKEGEFDREIHSLDTLAKVLRQNRLKSGAIAFGGSEVRFDLDEDGSPIGIKKKEMKEANHLIEEFMLMANKKVAEHIGKVAKNETAKPFVYRVHDFPDPSKIELLSTFVSKFGYKMATKKGKDAAYALNILLDAAKDQPEEDIIKTMAIRSMAKAVYETDNIGHYGLAFQHYTHFTSPIRRYPDLVVHRLLEQYKLNSKPYSKQQLDDICEHASINEKRAADAERASIKYKQVEYLSKRIGEEFEGIISGLTNWGMYIEILDGLCEGMVPISSLKDDYYSFDEENFVIIGRKHKHEYNLGDKVSIIVLSTDIYRRQIDFELIE